MSDNLLERLAESATEARAHYQVWWAIKHDGRAKHLPALNRFVDFFEATRIAHFRCMILALWKLFDRNTKTASLYALLEDADVKVSSELERELREHLAPRKILKGLNQVRHLFVAHRNALQSAEAIFSRADISPNELRDLIESSAELIRKIQRQSGESNTVFSSSRAHQSTVALLEALSTNA